MSEFGIPESLEDFVRGRYTSASHADPTILSESQEVATSLFLWGHLTESHPSAPKLFDSDYARPYSTVFPWRPSKTEPKCKVYV